MLLLRFSSHYFHSVALLQAQARPRTCLREKAAFLALDFPKPWDWLDRYIGVKKVPQRCVFLCTFLDVERCLSTRARLYHLTRWTDLHDRRLFFMPGYANLPVIPKVT